MTKKNIQYSLVGLGRMTALRVQGRRGFDGIVGSRCLELRQDDDAVDRGWHRSLALQAREWCGVHSVAGSGRTTLLRSWERHRALGDEACVVDSGTSSGRGRWRRIRASTTVGNDGAEAPGRTRWWCRCFREDSMMAWSLGKILAGNFGSLTACVRASGNHSSNGHKWHHQVCCYWESE
jgi:hypothetical protein